MSGPCELQPPLRGEQVRGLRIVLFCGIYRSGEVSETSWFEKQQQRQRQDEICPLQNIRYLSTDKISFFPSTSSRNCDSIMFL